MALGRDVYTQEKNEKAKTYLKTLYNEGDFSVIKQIYEVSKQCKKFRTQLLLLGQAASNPDYAELMFSFGIIPSVAVDSISKVKKTAYEFEKKNPRDVIKNYIETVCKSYPLEVQSSVRDYLFQVFDRGV
jgi:signal transduction protein with GAF and PtsI domain